MDYLNIAKARHALPFYALWATRVARGGRLQGGRPMAVFNPLGYLTPYASAFVENQSENLVAGIHDGLNRPQK
jgi:hypothetical protein